jgi:hypothetical protein
MPRVDEYRERLRSLPEEDWDEYLRRNSNLPGPRGNLELAAAVSIEAARDWLLERASIDAGRAPENTPEGFLTFCGVRGLGRLIADGDSAALDLLRLRASDPRWRIREAVAMAMQDVGDADMQRLLLLAQELSQGRPLEQRAAAAALAEPRLLRDASYQQAVIEVLDRVMRSMSASAERRSEDFRALRQGMGYCWSVVIEAYPDAGKPAFENWLASEDKDIRWLLRENLKKKRLLRMDADWVARCLEALA